MSYSVKIAWQMKPGEKFIDNKYSRVHAWMFDGGTEVKASSSPHIVPVPMSDEKAVDPEEAFIVSISSCHMLWFLSIAASKKYIVTNYSDNAEGILANDDDGRLAVTEITLRPEVLFTGSHVPSIKEVEELHHLAHLKCFIANSVKTKIIIQTIKENEI